MYDIAKREEFYQQEYCGCVYSLRDTNLHRVKRGDDRIDIGKKFYSLSEKKHIEEALNAQASSEDLRMGYGSSI